MIFALVGNQNCGKTTLFNALTGSNQHVGNFPGVTVDQKVGEVKGAPNCSVVDLPGIYSIRPYSQEEIVTRDFVLGGKPDGIINIVDATNIERNLYLTLQLLELRIPTVVALNMMDELTGNGGSVDIQKMSRALGVPVVPISAAKNEGVSELVRQFVRVAKERVRPKVMDFCPVGRCTGAFMPYPISLRTTPSKRGSLPGSAPRSSSRGTNPSWKCWSCGRTSRSFWSIPSLRWSMIPGWTGMRLWRPCAMTSLKRWRQSRW